MCQRHIANFPGSNTVTQLLFKLATPHAKSHDDLMTMMKMISDSHNGGAHTSSVAIRVHTNSPTLHTHTRQYNFKKVT